MSAAPNLKILTEVLAQPDRLSAVFHMVNRLLPKDQVVEAVEPETPARDALELMASKGYSQLPVKLGNSVLGVFTYRGFALEVARQGAGKEDPGDLPVEEFLHHEKPAYARLSDEFRELIDVLDQKDAVVVSGPDKLIAILTPMDVLRYLYSIANAFVLIEEIELTLRQLIRSSTSNPEVFRTCIENALTQKYGGGALPEKVEEMSFDDYVALLRDGRNWDHFKTTFGGTRERTRAKLEPIRDLRNDVFHFRRELSVEDHGELSTCRDWLFRCIRKLQARQGGPR